MTHGNPDNVICQRRGCKNYGTNQDDEYDWDTGHLIHQRDFAPGVYLYAVHKERWDVTVDPDRAPGLRMIDGELFHVDRNDEARKTVHAILMAYTWADADEEGTT